MTTTTDGRALRVDALQRIDASFERDWLGLWDRVDAPPWLHPAWTRLWWETFAAGRMAVVSVRRGERLVAVVPTMERGGERSAIANQESPGFGILAENPTAARAAAAALLAAGRPVNVFPIWSDQPGAAEIRAEAGRHRFRVLERSVGSSPFIDVSSAGRHDAALSAKLRREIRRRWNRLTDESAVAVSVVRDPEDVAEALERALVIERTGWKGRAGTAIAERDDALAFYRSLARWSSGLGWFLLAELRVDETVIAFDMSLEIRGVHYLLKTSFDPAWGRFAPGTLLRDAMLARAFALRLRRYEFLGKDDEWKREWTSEGHPRVQIRAFPPTPAGVLARMRWNAAWALRERLSTT
jgi:CelD/BcsL family acetyltransferase involved in cellulose biosynthesis